MIDAMITIRKVVGLMAIAALTIGFAFGFCHLLPLEKAPPVYQIGIAEIVSPVCATKHVRTVRFEFMRMNLSVRMPNTVRAPEIDPGATDLGNRPV